MSKEFNCYRCGKYLGEMTQGKIKKGTVLICTECIDAYKTIVDLNNYKKSSEKPYDMPEFFKGIFDKGGKK